MSTPSRQAALIPVPKSLSGRGVRGSWGRAALEGRPNPAASASPFPWLQPQLAPPSLSLALNLLYNFKIKF